MATNTTPTKPVTRDCSCSNGCPAQTKRLFAPGHDARMVGRLRNEVVAGTLTPADAIAEAVKRSDGSELLVAKVRRSVELATTKQAAKADAQPKVAPTGKVAQAKGRAPKPATKAAQPAKRTPRTRKPRAVANP
ncbi:MAG TPA: hypothetical protein VFU43_25240 [Streptosporangiaceae bacterium]|nr:hypothetical protein [Streptosporangiaceae bacterium]